MKQCTNVDCLKWLPETEEYFYKQLTRSKKKGDYYKLANYCKNCTSKKALEYKRKNRDKALEWQRKYNQHDYIIERKRDASKKRKELGKEKEWQQNNPEKIRGYNSKRKSKNHIISKNEWKECKEYFNNSCAYCGMTEQEHRKVNRNHDLHKEHVDDEGSVYLDNCVPACCKCNVSKHTFSLKQWYNESNQNFTIERMQKINNWLNKDYLQYFKGYRPKRKFKSKNTKIKLIFHSKGGSY